MSTGVPLPRRGLLIAVAGCAITAALSLTNLAASLLGFTWARVETPTPLGPTLGFLPDNALLTMAVAGALAGALGLLVLHRRPGVGWSWLLLAGTVLTGALVLPELPGALDRNPFDSVPFVAAIGAGPVLVLTGLLGAASWLRHAAGTGIGVAVGGFALAAPVPGLLLLAVVAVRQPPFAALRALNVTLAIVGIAGAVAAGILLWMGGRGVEPPRPSPKLTALGVIAAALPAVPSIAVRIGWSRSTLDFDNPNDPFTGNLDRWVVLVGLCGLAIFTVAVGLAAGLGTKPLGAVLATGLVLYGVGLPIGLARASTHSSAGLIVIAVLGLALGVAAAISRWRAWVAGGACVLAGVIVLLVQTGERPSEPAAWVLLLFGMVGAVATFAASVDALAEAPAVLGMIAVAVQVGLFFSTNLLYHSAISTAPGTLHLLIIAAGVALLLGALLVVAVRLTPGQAALSPGPAR